VIRRLDRGDARELAALLTRNRAFLEPFEPVRDDRFFTAAGQAARIAAHEQLFAILDGEAIAGTIALSNVVRGAFRSANVGYWVDRARNGRGLATAAVAAVAETAFGELGLHRLEAGTLVDNAASRRVLERNRFTRIGVAPRYLHIGGAWRDHVLYQRTAED
jgi:ribosomal-protein-alanine N-acetyltransferase